MCLSNQPTLSLQTQLKGLRSQSRAVSKVAGGLEKLRGPLQVPPKSTALVPRPAAVTCCAALGDSLPGVRAGKGVPPVSRADVRQGMLELCVAGSEGAGY